MWYDNEQLAVMEGHSRPVTDVKWINSVFFLSASQDQGIFLWKVNVQYMQLLISYCVILL